MCGFKNQKANYMFAVFFVSYNQIRPIQLQNIQAVNDYKVALMKEKDVDPCSSPNHSNITELHFIIYYTHKKSN
jgi:hypothetical protein